MNKNVIFILGSIVIVLGALIYLTFASNNSAKMDVNYDMVDNKEALQEEVELTDFYGLANGQPVLGDVDAPLTLIAFGDYKCSHCLNYENNAFNEIYEKYVKTGIIKYHFVNMQTLSQDSIRAGIVGEAIYEQNEADFWSYHRAVYESFSSEFTNEKLISMVEENTENVDITKIEKVLAEPTDKLNEVYKDSYLANAIGVQGTPTLILEGVKVNADISSMDAMVEMLYDAEKKERKDVEVTQELLDEASKQ